MILWLESRRLKKEEEEDEGRSEETTSCFDGAAVFECWNMDTQRLTKRAVEAHHRAQTQTRAADA